MIRSKSALLRLSLALVTLRLAGVAADSSAAQRESLKLDADWRFQLGDVPGAETSAFDDAAWRKVNLPHDWSIEGKPDVKNATGSGEGYFPAGTGWYRKTFDAPKAWVGKLVRVEFDGVYRNATVYLNGHQLGTHDYGYSSFSFGLSQYLNAGKRNTLAVRVDNSAQPNSRWYSGSGIYRHVRLGGDRFHSGGEMGSVCDDARSVGAAGESCAAD